MSTATMAIPPVPARRSRREGGRETTTRRAGKVAEGGGAGTTTRRAGMGGAGRVAEGGVGGDVRVVGGTTCLETIPVAARAEKTRHRHHGGIRLATMMIPVAIVRAKRPSPPSATWRGVTIAWVRPCL